MKFKKFLEEMVQFDYTIFYTDKDGKDKTKSVKATLQNDALNKFKALDSVRGYRNIITIKKGGVVPPSEEK